MDHPVIHFEIPANDMEKMKKFYTDLFGWKIEGAGPLTSGQWSVVRIISAQLMIA
jgi:predicted enzyme related to lactoylglutathione lyase